MSGKAADLRELKSFLADSLPKPGSGKLDRKEAGDGRKPHDPGGTDRGLIPPRG